MIGVKKRIFLLALSVFGTIFSVHSADRKHLTGNRWVKPDSVRIVRRTSRSKRKKSEPYTTNTVSNLELAIRNRDTLDEQTATELNSILLELAPTTGDVEEAKTNLLNLLRDNPNQHTRFRITLDQMASTIKKNNCTSPTPPPSPKHDPGNYENIESLNLHFQEGLTTGPNQFDMELLESLSRVPEDESN